MYKHGEFLIIIMTLILFKIIVKFPSIFNKKPCSKSTSEVHL